VPFFFVENLFSKFYEFATNTGELSMSDTPSLQRSCLDECVFVGLHHNLVGLGAPGF
jgi:hypothetical protein